MLSQEIKERNLFDDFGLELVHGEVKIGKTYPIYGMITDIISTEPGNVVAKINKCIIARINISDSEKIETLKQRAFESGIFVSRVTETEPRVEVECKTIIFGKRQEMVS
jgi:hypothetical protein